MNISDNDFQLFGVAATYAQDRVALDARWKELQREAHPDRFAAQGGAAQRTAMQWSVRINEAYQRLKDPLRRAAYLCELNGAPIDAERNTAMPPDFLMQQMAWREALDEARASHDVACIAQEVSGAREEALTRLAVTIDQAADFAAAARQVRALMFFERFMQDLDARADALDNAAQGQ